MSPATQNGAGTSTDILAVANQPVLWICALGVFFVIIVQSVIYMRAAERAAPAAGMTREELRTAFRSGAVAAVGPSLAVVVVAVALLAVFGGPAVLVRIGLIGSAAYETAAAGVSAHSMGAALGDGRYTQNVFAVAFFAMSLGGAMWMLATLILTPLLSRGQTKLASVNPTAMALIPVAAFLGAFFALGVAEFPKSSTHIVAFLVAAAVMGTLIALGRALKISWLAEWALGIAIIAGLTAAHLAGGTA